MGRVEYGSEKCRGWWGAGYLAAIAYLLLPVVGCKPAPPTVTFESVPIASRGGVDTQGAISGRVRGFQPKDRIVLYARAGRQWWVQPSADSPYSAIKSDGTWNAEIHLGAEYAALVVNPGFKPDTVIDALPAPNATIRSVSVVPGKQSLSLPSEHPTKTLRFGGYYWTVRNVPSSYGGKDHYYSEENVRIDSDGNMRLRLARTENKWVCAEARTVRALGYGDYRFELKDVGRLPSAAMFSLFILGPNAGSGSSEMDLHISRWGNEESSNAEYVIQPYYLPANGFRFEMPPGKVTTTIQWTRDRAQFESFSPQHSMTKPLATQTFTSGVPLFTGQHAFVNLCEFSYSRKKLDEGTEVVIEKFQFLP